MKTIVFHLQKIDLFAKPFIFEERDHQKFTTITGMILTICLIITSIVIGFLFGREIYERKSPNVLTSNDKIDYSRVEMQDFPIFFTFIDGPANYISEAKNHIDMEITQLILSETLSPKVNYYPGYKRCNATDFSDPYVPYVEKIYSDLNTYELFCINQNDLYTQNDYSSSNSSFINVRFLLCDLEEEGCGTEEDRIALLKDLYVVVVYVDAFVDPSKYTDPTYYYYTTMLQKVGEEMLQRNFFSVQRTKLITHRGWLLEDIFEEEIFNVRSIVKDVSTSYDGNLFWFTLDSPNIRTKIIRSYMKIQDVIAKIGGFFNGLFIAAMLLSKSYVDFSYYNYIYNHFVKDKNKKISSKSLAKTHTIDQVVMKMAISNINYSNNLDNNNLDDISSNNINDNIKENSVNNDNINIINNNVHNSKSNSPQHITNNYVNMNFQNPNNNNNSELNIINKTEKPGVQVKITNDFKREKKDDACNTNNNIKNKQSLNLEMKEINHNSKLNKFNTFSLKNLEISKKMSYLSFVYNDILCFRDKFGLNKKAVSKIISFENIMEVSYEYFIKNNLNDTLKSINQGN